LRLLDTVERPDDDVAIVAIRRSTATGPEE
jgi:hypothetical protein